MRGCKRQLLWQNLLIVVASYIFYGWWDWRFLLLIAITTILSFLSGIGIEKAPTQRWKKVVMIANVVVNLGILGIYKYYDFFATQFAQLFGIESDFLLLHLILPVGISFYTFQALSYSIDVYRKQIEQTHDIVAFTAFLSFFPQLVAGPIERATNLLPQFQKKRTFDYTQAVDGMRQILWGLFKKIVVADNCAVYVDQVFGDIGAHLGSTLLLAAVLFTFQIYGDFSGYSDIAIGTAKLFGIKLMRNFNVPYFSRDIAEFWRRWHISLTTWFRDYVYIPLGGSRPNIPEAIRRRGDKAIEARYKKAIAIRNTFVIFLLSGFWHGANWTFVLWGAYHALLFVPLLVMNKNRRYRDDERHIQDVPKMLITFVLLVIGWVVFRSPSITACGEYFMGICNSSLLTMPYIENTLHLGVTLLAIIAMLIIEWRKLLPNRWWIYYVLIIAIWWFAGQDIDFIYFQF
jgi:D-alanyl-lipoteichoic acid acyltransferase DltB (MBOAT superfamily)